MARFRRLKGRRAWTWVTEFPISFYVAVFLHFILHTLIILSVIQMGGAEYYRFWNLGGRESEHLIWILIICHTLAGYFLLIEAFSDLKFSSRRLPVMVWAYGLTLLLICSGLVVLRGNFYVAHLAGDTYRQAYVVQYIPTYLAVREPVTPELIRNRATCELELTVGFWDRNHLYRALSPHDLAVFDDQNVRIRFSDFNGVEVLLDGDGHILVDRPYSEGVVHERWFNWLLRHIDGQAREQGCEALNDIPHPPWSPRLQTTFSVELPL